MDKFLSLIPFLLVTQHQRSGDNCSTTTPPIKLNVQRIIEGVIIAAIAGAVSGYVSVAKLEVKVDGIHTEVKAVEARICEENKRQESRIDDNLNRIERLTDSILKNRK